MIIYVFGVGETQSYKFKRDPLVVTSSDQMGQEIYNKLCVECHGDDGKKGLFKAPDLTTSALSVQEKQERILNGKGVMRGYANELNDQQVEAVINYISSIP